MRKALLGLLIVVLFGGAIVATVFSLLGRSDACALAMEQARASQQVKEQLGEPLEQGLFVTGNINLSGGSGRAQLAIPISGPKGKGTLYIVATKSMGVWKADALQLAGNGNSFRIDLLQGADSRGAAPSR
ncbi:MAG TPA: cytochrome c oxidase assembly factor Coa1 family protein [Candidatus Solibacter sp.]|nr:cytochrome c oxidase assembly factor Coa1 family protein [Candidatus Solibacter sp.]